MPITMNITSETIDVFLVFALATRAHLLYLMRQKYY